MQKQQIRFSLNAAAWFFVGQAEDDGAPKSVPIKTPFQIGRNPDIDFCLPCSSVSGLHAEIREVDNELWLFDLNSTNGTFINGKRIESKCRLKKNDTVQFGTTVFHVSCEQNSQFLSEDDSEGDASNRLDQRFEQLFIDGVVPFFQPILVFEEGDPVVTGYEVLGRSRLYGLQTPAQMFAAASRLEMEADLSRVLRKRGVEVADKHLPEKYSLFVNTHPAELECGGLKESLFEIRDDHPTRPIVLEVHESVLNETDKFVKLRSTLENLDIQLAFHDFGAGQIRLSELGEICPDVVKFDVKLVQGIDKASSKKQRLVRSLVKMVTEMGITPMAECIERADEHQTLQQLGFKLGQGFLYGRPSSIENCTESAGKAPGVGSLERVPQVKSFLDKSADNESADIDIESLEKIDHEPKDANWLLEQPGHCYTIQVLSAISEKRAAEHIAMQDDPEQFAVFCKQGKTRMLYIVVKGIFEDRAAAKAASCQLANSMVSPWIRLLSSVHAEIRS